MKFLLSNSNRVSFNWICIATQVYILYSTNRKNITNFNFVSFPYLKWCFHKRNMLSSLHFYVFKIWRYNVAADSSIHGHNSIHGIAYVCNENLRIHCFFICNFVWTVWIDFEKKNLVSLVRINRNKFQWNFLTVKLILLADGAITNHQLTMPGITQQQWTAPYLFVNSLFYTEQIVRNWQWKSN